MSAPPAVAPDTARHVGDTAIVVGASMAGLCSARVLADRFDAVVVIDRDRLPHRPEPRRQVPQGRHPHLLLTAGARLLEGWLPGILDQLRASGAVISASTRRRPAPRIRPASSSSGWMPRKVASDWAYPTGISLVRYATNRIASVP